MGIVGDPDKHKWSIGWLYTLVFAGVTGFYILSAVQESKTYNKLTGAKTTWWDALWVELRVQDHPK